MDKFKINKSMNDDRETMTGAVLNEAATRNSAKRKEITDFIVKLYDTLEKTSTKNSEKFLASTSKLSDVQFIALMTSIANDPKKHLYFEIEAFKNEPEYETIEKAANDVVGDEYVHLYDYIAFPHLSEDPNKPQYSIHKIFNGYINIRRVQQLVNNKNHITTNTDKRDPKTGQVTMESKAARISDSEMYGMICHGTKNILKEMYGPRGGDPVMRNELEYQIATKGSASLSEMTDSKLNKPALNTANMMLLAAGLETDMVTRKGILPRTVQMAHKDARTLERKEQEGSMRS